MVTDYDCWHTDHDQVDVAQIIACMMDNAAKAKMLVTALAGAMTGPRSASPIDTALTNAIITAPHARDPAIVAKLSVVAGRALRG
jgi:5'-methylthioadenosine phosphorylase